MLDKGHFIVVEGLEGAGKSTALHTIQDFLLTRQVDVITTREPGGTRVGDVVRALIKETLACEPLDPRTELLLFYAARVQLLEHVICPAIKRGTWVLADRFELSTFAYQGGGRKLDEKMIAHLSAFCVQSIKPDLIIFLDVDPEIGLQRALRRGTLDRIEQESRVFFQDVHTAYHERMKTMDNVVCIDATQPLLQVQYAIQQALQQYMNQHAISPIY